jgi:purine-binding chemotaxis protein CheW
MGAIVRSARQVEPAAKAHDQQQYLTFQVGGEVFAIAILGIREIIEYHGLTTVPMMPAFIRGVINLRGRVVPVVDLAARFGRPSNPVGKRTCIVILETSVDNERHDIGVVVDMVNAVLEIPAGEIEPAPAFGAKVRADFISGMGKVAGKFVIILNVDKVLSIEELAMLDRFKEGERAHSQEPGNGASGNALAAA